MSGWHEAEGYQVQITGISGWTKGERERAVRDGVGAAARLLATRGVDCRGVLDLHGDEDVEREIAEILAHVRKHGRETTVVPPPVDIPIPVVDEKGEMAEDPRMATPEGRLEVFKEAAAKGNVVFAEPEFGGVEITYNVRGACTGFGSFTVSMDEDGIHVDDECMSREFAEALWQAIIKHRKE